MTRPSLLLLVLVAACSGERDSKPATSNQDTAEDSISDSVYPCGDVDHDGACYYEDCGGNNPDMGPFATEICNGIDDNCDGDIDEGVTTTFYKDADTDGYGDPELSTEACGPSDTWVPAAGDCDDTDPLINPAMPETCDGQDNNCDGTTDEGCTPPALTTPPPP